MNQFEGDYNQGHLLPTVNHEAIISGTFKMFGKVIVHSVLMEGPGFPCFPPAMYRYITGTDMEHVIPHLSSIYLPMDIQHVINEINSAPDDVALAALMLDDMCANVVCNSGCTSVLKISSRYSVVQSILLYETILRRKPMIDEIMEGLDSLGFRKLLQAFPDEMEHLFVGGPIIPVNETLCNMLQAPSTMSESQSATFQMLQEYVLELDSEYCRRFLQFVTGSSTIPPIGLSIPNIQVTFIRQATFGAIQASTCFSLLKIPEFPNLSTLRVAMNSVISGDSFTSV